MAALAEGDAPTAAVYFARSAAKGELSKDGYLAWGDADWQAESPQTALQIWEIATRLGASLNEILPRQAEAYRFLGDDLALIKTLVMMLAVTMLTHMTTLMLTRTVNPLTLNQY